jgi:hypothetical protein
MEHIKLIDTEYDGEPKVLALVAPRLQFTGGPANTIQMQIEFDGQEAYTELWLHEAILLRDKLNEWILEKEAYNNKK